MPNHSTSSANIVPKGTAPEDFSPQMKRLSTKNMAKTMPGNMKAVLSVFIFHEAPLNVL